MSASAQAEFERGVLAFRAGNFAVASQHAAQAVRAQPSHEQAWKLLSMAQMKRNDFVAAEQAASRMLELSPSNWQAYELTALSRRSRGQTQAALEAADAGLQHAPSEPTLAALKAELLFTLHVYDEALASLEAFLDDERPRYQIAAAFSTLSSWVGQRERSIRQLERLVNDSELGKVWRIDALMRLATHKDALGDYDAAFRYAKQANDLKLPREHVSSYAASVEAMLEGWTKDVVDATPSSTNTSEIPVYIVGMPRSGTSLVEQIIASHPAAFGANERHDIHAVIAEHQPPELGFPWHLTVPSTLTVTKLNRDAKQMLSKLRELAPDAERITSKNPLNYLNLGLISKLFPRVRVIHCKRDPLDTCVSCYLHNMVGHHAFNQDLELLGGWYRQYERVMDHWRDVLDISLLEVQYEDLARHPEEGIRRIIDFVDLPWDDRCLRFHETKRATLTPSAEQVRKPMYLSSIGRWRNYEPHLGPLFESLQVSPLGRVSLL